MLVVLPKSFSDFLFNFPIQKQLLGFQVMVIIAEEFGDQHYDDVNGYDDVTHPLDSLVQPPGAESVDSQRVLVNVY